MTHLIGLRVLTKEGHYRGRIKAVLDADTTQNMLVIEFDEPRKDKIKTDDGVQEVDTHMQVYMREDVIIL